VQEKFVLAAIVENGLLKQLRRSRDLKEIAARIASRNHKRKTRGKTGCGKTLNFGPGGEKHPSGPEDHVDLL
jgi:hypothetical protein